MKSSPKKGIFMKKETLTEVNDGIRLIQDPKGLTFGTDALMLAGFIRPEPRAHAAEYGSGSGIISLLLASRDKLGSIDAIEKQQYFAELTKRNAENNSLAHKINALCLDIRELRGEYDVIFTNPPYMRVQSGKRNEDDGKYEARHEVNGSIDDFCTSASKNLRFGGKFYCVYRPDRAIDLLSAMRDAKIEPKRIVFVSQDGAHDPSLMLVEGKRGGKSGGVKVKNLYLCDRDGTPTEDASYIYESGNFPKSFA